MGDDDHRAGILPQGLLQPLHRLGVEVVGGLVQQQQVGLFQQGHAQGHAAPLAAGKLPDGVSSGGSTRASEAMSIRRSISQPSQASIFSWSWPISSMQLVQVVACLGLGHAGGNLR